MPIVEVISEEYNRLQCVIKTQCTLKDAYDNAQEGVADLRPDVDNLILRIWDEVETAYDDEPASSKRRKAREWGVVYHSTQKTTITGLVTDAATGVVLPNVNVTLLESENTVQTDDAGNYTLITTYVGQGTFEFSLESYATQSIQVEVPEGGAVELNMKLNRV